MRVKKVNVPTAVRKAFEVGLAEFVNEGDPLRRLKDAPVDGVPVFTLTLDDLNREPADSARPAGWRLFIGDDSTAAVAVDVIVADGKDPQMTAFLNDTDSIGREMDAIAEIRRQNRAGNIEYEPRMLRIPGVLVEAFWLKARRDSDDKVVPVLTMSRTLERYREYPMSEFLQISRALARKFSGFDAMAETIRQQIVQRRVDNQHSAAQSHAVLPQQTKLRKKEQPRKPRGKA